MEVHGIVDDTVAEKLGQLEEMVGVVRVAGVNRYGYLNLKHRQVVWVGPEETDELERRFPPGGGPPPPRFKEDTHVILIARWGASAGYGLRLGTYHPTDGNLPEQPEDPRLLNNLDQVLCAWRGEPA